MDTRRSCKLLLAATGSVAALKIPTLIKALLEIPADQMTYDFEVHLVVTEHAKHFFKMSDLPAHVKVYDDSLEWQAWKQRGDPVLHIELGKLADIMVIAPLDANTLAKMAQGLCDNLLTCTTRAWDMSKPLIFCPAMNTRMWEHPVTTQQIRLLKEWGHMEIPPISKTLMCGDTGVGAMAEVETIVEKIKNVADEKFNVKFD
ncbi:phosphopantothenoylcysteine decarboxylase-like [Spodoptera litura]|uniref:Phosphopantothenoylcysteine decarboxylase n=1 Tax=Spodoptera litura TaxID=69820 RepID=A0A9J7IKB8_SPOLT|nr:phosphopantothenoylcysteine decarboxylase-like [Spodoptera litura]